MIRPHQTTVADKAKQARREVLKMIHKAQTSHVASNFSVIDIATVLYEQLNHDLVYDNDGFNEKPGGHDADLVVWSKGWAAASAYYFLAQAGYIPEKDLKKFPNAPYLGLAETTVPGILCNGGAVGHGTPIAVGLALGKKKAKYKGNVYCIMSDGELNEGTVWESAMMAVHLGLDNLVFIVDGNKWQAMGKTSDVCKLDACRAFEGFGWDVNRVDGHDHEQLRIAFNRTRLNGLPEQGNPMFIFCDTIKGKGVSFMENHLLYHYKNVDDETFKEAMKELV